MPSSALVLLGVLVAIAAMGSVAFIQDPNNVQIGYHPSQMVTSVSSTNPSDGLELQLNLNVTSIPQGGTVGVSVAEYNRLAVVNNVTASGDWGIPRLNDGPCGALNNAVGYEVLSGYYTTSNVSSAKPLQLYEPGVYFCPVTLSGIEAYGFHPLSSLAAVYGSCGTPFCFNIVTSYAGAVRGYWGPTLLADSSFHVLSPGVYTVVAGDEWGVLEFAYFVVD